MRLLLLTMALAAQPGPWRDDGVVDGVRIERRAVPGSKFDELQLTTRSEASLQSLCDAIWAKGRVGKNPEGDFKQRIVVSETGDERVTYEQIKVPVASDRDYVMRVKLVQPASSGRCEVAFETVQHPAYPPRADHVRIPVIRGSWQLVPDASGKVDICYRVFSDPGGNVPAIFARGSQRDAALSFLKVILARVWSK